MMEDTTSTTLTGPKEAELKSISEQHESSSRGGGGGGGDESDNGAVAGGGGTMSTTHQILETSSNLLKETASSMAKHHQDNNDHTNRDYGPLNECCSSPPRVTTTTTMIAGTTTTTTTSSTPDRLLQGTAASRARHAATITTTPDIDNKNLPPIPDVGGPSPRLLKGTEAFEGRIAYSPTNFHHTPLDAEKEATETSIRVARVNEMVQKEIKEQERILLLQEERQRKQIEQKEKTQSSLDLARERRQKAAELERRRIEQLQIKIASKEKKVQQRHTTLKDLHKVDLRPHSTTTTTTTPTSTPNKRNHHPILRPPLTVPIEPKFATDSRLGRTSRRSPTSAAGRDTPAMAQGDDVLRSGLRTGSRLFDGKSKQRRTIPQGPKFTSTSHRSTTTTTPTPHTGDDMTMATSTDFHAWEGSLRTSPPKSEPRNKKGSSSSSSSSPPRTTTTRALTVPVGPKFHTLHHHERPKSTAELEEETINYYKAHPFKARPNQMNMSSSPARHHHNIPTMAQSEPRRLTVPKPFHLSTDSRAALRAPPAGTTTKGDNHHTPYKDAQPFRARPMPDFSSTKKKKTPNSSSSAPWSTTTTRSVTQPKPFHFYTDDRIVISSPLRKNDVKSSSSVKNTPASSSWSNRSVTQPKPFHFHTDDRITTGSPPRKDDESSSPSKSATKFKARPLPDFYGGGSSMNTPGIRDRDPFSRLAKHHHSTKLLSSVEQSPEVRIKPFRARPMPKFSSPSTVVSATTYVPNFSSPPPKKSHGHHDKSVHFQVSLEKSTSKGTFKAKPMPDFSKPFVPAPSSPEDREKRIRSMRGEEDPTTPQREKEPSSSTPSFKARPMPDFSKLALPVSSNKSANKRRGRTRSKSSSPTPIKRLSPIAFKAREMPDFSVPFVPSSSPKKINHPKIRSKSASPNATRRKSSSSTFKARKMPDFSKPLILVSPRRPEKTHSPSKKLSSGKQGSSPAKKSQPKRVRKPGGGGGGSPRFKARAAPDFSKPHIAVRHQSPTKVVHPTQGKSPKSPAVRNEMESVFRARTLPDFSKQMIPVRDRDPNKLRSPDSVKAVHKRNCDVPTKKKKEGSSKKLPSKRGPHKPTVPILPTFHNIHHRELPKSREEQEKEEMEYFRAHPFKANPIKTFHFNSSPTHSNKSPQSLTTPRPFHLHTDSRARKAPATEPRSYVGRIELQDVLRARTGMSSTRSLQKATPQSSKSRQTTTTTTEQSQPFHFFTDERTAVSSPQRTLKGTTTRSIDGDEHRSIVSSRSTEELLADLAGMELQLKMKPQSPN